MSSGIKHRGETELRPVRRLRHSAAFTSLLESSASSAEASQAQGRIPQFAEFSLSKKLSTFATFAIEQHPHARGRPPADALRPISLYPTRAAL